MLVRFDRISVVFVVARFRVCVDYVLFGLTDCCLFVFTVVCCLGDLCLFCFDACCYDTWCWLF